MVICGLKKKLPRFSSAFTVCQGLSVIDSDKEPMWLLESSGFLYPPPPPPPPAPTALVQLSQASPVHNA